MNINKLALKKITKQALLRNGIGCDLISISKPPLHSVPMFMWTEKDSNAPQVK